MNPPVAKTPTPQTETPRTDAAERALAEWQANWHSGRTVPQCPVSAWTLCRTLERENIELRAKLADCERVLEEAKRIQGDQFLRAEAAESSLRERDEDAERYRWLRTCGEEAAIYAPDLRGVIAQGEMLDAAIDAARGQS